MIFARTCERKVYSRVRASGFGAGVRFFHLRYEKAGMVGVEEVRSILAKALPAGTLWHAACLSTREAHGVGCEGSERGVPVQVWTDVLVDFGAVSVRSSVCFESSAFALRERIPSVRACSGAFRDGRSQRWQNGWGGPFGVAFDCEVGMYSAQVEVWRDGGPLLIDKGEAGDSEAGGAARKVRYGRRR